MTRIAVVGCPRSGTTMFYTMLRNTVTNWKFYDTERPANLSDDRCISKRPLDLLSGPLDGVKYIVVVRDPRDIMCSHHKNAPGFFISAGKCSVVGGRALDIGVAGMFAKFAEYSDHVFIRYEDLIFDPDAVQIELGKAFGFEYSGPFDEAWEDGPPKHMAAALNGNRPPDNKSIGKWKNYMERIAEQFREYPELFDYLIQYGYEKDRTWTQNLQSPA